MNDYGKWKERECSVTSLLLDSQNPRIPEVTTTPTQRDIAAELVTHDNVYELARDIAEQGFFPTERLIGIENESGDIVLEGNRRLAALKLLLAPELAPEHEVKKFRALSEKVPKAAISKVMVVFAPSREAAAPLIVNRHTRLGIHRWQPAQQAKYMRTLVRADMSIDDVAKQFGVSKGELIKNLKTDSMYQVACALDLTEPVAAIVRNPRQFNSSVLERLVQSSDAMSFLGVEFGENGSITGKIDPGEFKKAFGRMVTDIATGQEDTRTLNKNSDIETYLKKFGSDAPNKKLKGSFTGESLLGKASPPSEAKPSKPSKGGTKKPSAALIPAGVKCHLDSPRINEVFRELRQLSVKQFPNAAGALLRILFEMVINNYLEKTGKLQPLLEKAKKEKKPADWSPTARQMLRAVLADAESVKHLNPLALKGLNKLANDDDHPLSLDKMDQFVHNSYVAPSEAELRKLWHVLEKLIVPMLTEPTVPDPKTGKVTK